MKLNCTLPFVCPDNIKPHLEKVFQGEYDIPLYLKRPPMILDLGANCGAFSVWASHRWPGSSIFAYEPHPENYKYLHRNIHGYPKVFGFNYGVGNPGLRPLSDGRFNCGEASFHKVINNPLPTAQHIEVRSPLEVLTEADIIKIDTEGCEVEILKPLIESGRKFKAIMFEWHNESDRRILDSLLVDYNLVGSEVAHPIGRGVSKYLHREVHECVFSSQRPASDVP